VDIKKVIRSFCIGFELYGLDMETKNKGTLEYIEEDLFSNEVVYKKTLMYVKKKMAKIFILSLKVNLILILKII
jgi:hypothetical protein